jgi:predicted metal-dependent hydrolase
MPIHRFVPGRALPAYAFVPGRHPHPESDPAGHSFGLARAHVAAVDARNWQSSEAYVFGLDLFNQGYYWEAHVEFEALWHAAGRHGPTADFLKGLIRLAAAGVKHRAENARGVRSHAEKAAELWREVKRGLAEGQERFLGLHVRELIEVAERVCLAGWPEEQPVLVPAFSTSSPEGGLP